MPPVKTPPAAPEKKFLSAPVAHFKVVDAEQGIVEAIVNTYSIPDYANDRTVPGCCDKSLARKLPTICWMHDWMQPVGKTLEAHDLKPGDERLPEKIRHLGGLYVKGQFNLKTSRGRDAFYDVAEEVIDEYSIGYYEIKTKIAKDGVNDLLEIDLVEWSPVLRGCNPITMTLDAKQRAARDTNKRPTKESRMNPKTASTDAKTKSQYLGEYAESDAAIGAIDRLNSRLMYYALYDLLYYNEDEGEDVETQLSEIAAAFDEFRDISLRFVRAAMEGGSESVESARKSLREFYPDPDAASPAGAAFHKQLDSALDVVNDCLVRAQSIATIRAKDQRTLSSDRLEQIERLKTGLDTLLEDAKRAPVSEITEAHMKLLQRKQALRASVATATL